MISIRDFAITFDDKLDVMSVWWLKTRDDLRVKRANNYLTNRASKR